MTITLNRPEKKNAINGPMWDELLATFREIAASERRPGRGHHRRRWGVLLRRRPERRRRRHAASAATMAQHAPRRRRVHRPAADPQPTIAKVGGVAAGAGCNMALGCDLIVASDEARFSEIFARRGLSIDFGGSWLLPRLVGHAPGQGAGAVRRHHLGQGGRGAWGSSTGSCRPASWTRSSTTGPPLAAGPPIALAQTKRLLNNAFEVTLEQALEDEGWAQTVNFGTADTAEAMQAFLAEA